MNTTEAGNAVWFTTKGQVVIPRWLRKPFNIEAGTKAVVQATPDGILLKPVTRWAIERGFGMLKRKPGGKSFRHEWAEHKREERDSRTNEWRQPFSMLTPILAFFRGEDAGIPVKELLHKAASATVPRIS